MKEKTKYWLYLTLSETWGHRLGRYNLRFPDSYFRVHRGTPIVAGMLIGPVVGVALEKIFGLEYGLELGIVGGIVGGSCLEMMVDRFCSNMHTPAHYYFRKYPEIYYKKYPNERRH